jgi:hypothetical protein
MVYAEFLPLLLGQKIARQFDLLPNTEGYFMGYDPKEDPSTYNEFATAAARYGHTLVKEWQVRGNKKYETFSNRTIDYYQFNPEFKYTYMKTIFWKFLSLLGTVLIERLLRSPGNISCFVLSFFSSFMNGKSCMLLRFTDQTFRAQHETTIGVDFGSQTLTVRGSTRVKIQIWDTAGSEKFRSLS